MYLADAKLILLTEGVADVAADSRPVDHPDRELPRATPPRRTRATSPGAAHRRARTRRCERADAGRARWSRARGHHRASRSFRDRRPRRRGGVDRCTPRRARERRARAGGARRAAACAATHSPDGAGAAPAGSTGPRGYGAHHRGRRTRIGCAARAPPGERARCTARIAPQPRGWRTRGCRGAAGRVARGCRGAAGRVAGAWLRGANRRLRRVEERSTRGAPDVGSGRASLVYGGSCGRLAGRWADRIARGGTPVAWAGRQGWRSDSPA